MRDAAGLEDVAVEVDPVVEAGELAQLGHLALLVELDLLRLVIDLVDSSGHLYKQRTQEAGVRDPGQLALEVVGLGAREGGVALYAAVEVAGEEHLELARGPELPGRDLRQLDPVLQDLIKNNTVVAGVVGELVAARAAALSGRVHAVSEGGVHLALGDEVVALRAHDLAPEALALRPQLLRESLHKIKSSLYRYGLLYAEGLVLAEVHVGALEDATLADEVLNVGVARRRLPLQNRLAPLHPLLLEIGVFLEDLEVGVRLQGVVQKVVLLDRLREQLELVVICQHRLALGQLVEDAHQVREQRHAVLVLLFLQVPQHLSHYNLK